ncbi:hypothetical protein CIP107577_00129 [Corynebacterium diphtheriae]|uniref:hypothetical protein n=1 Tax=Corynebacterium diphtheriae TaxID=1717 RepID=UPI000D747962|nr:hypothetical protein [Corynebacterium diphtheriae]AWR15538.1 hypothetical protein B11Q_00838 [Corynebacterium diphtheriae]CAB0627175.1 hypothetical protein CIP107577_00129 [Corynebacterium diphtheriae]
MPLPALIADGGELTVVRRLAFFVYGYWDVDWPDDFEPPKLEEGLRLGYVGRLNESDPGLSARRFIREDVSITATNDQTEPPELGTSNVEEIFDTAVSKASGEVFFEKDITNAGLGRLRPLTDFFVGDRVPVFLWGRILAGQLITAIDCIGTATEPVGYRVHVGGQVLGDAVARARQKKDMQRDIAAERRARLRDVGGVSSVASAAKDAAKVADRKAEDADAKAETADGKAEDALEKWRQQKDELDQVQSELIRKNAEWNRLQDVGLKELEAQQEAMKRYVELSRPGTVTADSWDPVWAGPVQVSYPSRNRIQLYLSPSNAIVGASVLGVARVSALSGYSFSFTADIRAGETVTPSVGSFEAFQQVSVTVHPIVNFAAILTEERRKRGLQ